LETDPNRLEAEAIARELAEMDASLPSAGGPDADASLAFTEEPDIAASPAFAGEPGMAANPAVAGEPDFSSFDRPATGPLLPRWLFVSVLSLLGAGAVILAGMFVAEERKTDKTMELVAANSRSAIDVPAVPVAAPLPGKKPTDMVFLKEASPTRTIRADKQPDAAVESAAPAAPRPVAASEGKPEADSTPAIERVAKAAPSKAKPAVKAATAKSKPVAKAAAAKAKPAAKKKKPEPKNAAVLARSGETQTWPRKRGDSITERLNAAVAACRARPHAPGECNLRACDILGSSDPACR
jgi:hypothetical protein